MKIESCYTAFGKLIKERRVQFGISQADLGKKLGLSRVSVASIEAGAQRILFHHGVFLCALFRIDLNNFKPSVSEEIKWE